MNAITLALTHIPGGQAGLAKALQVTPQAVNQWAKGHRPIPARHCLAIEAASNGAVTRYALRPDVFGLAPAGQAA